MNGTCGLGERRESGITVKPECMEESSAKNRDKENWGKQQLWWEP